ncbi:organic cation transporter-like protein [Convolutriloba macropyga]|uniref:organic cation transporter-like protein n=1 Tax=Convolutriloba macropyga TaxID=536237 RepID=UPI003F51EC24
MSLNRQPSDFDSNLEAAGSFGRAQIMLIILNCYITSYVGWQAYIPVFSTREDDFYCADDLNFTLSDLEPHQISLVNFPDDDHQFKSLLGNGTPSYGDECTKGCHKYVYKPGISSVITDFDLACGSKQILPALSTSVYWAAYFISCFISGALSDRFGRKKVSLGLLVGLTISTTITIFCTDIYMYIALRFVAGFCALNASMDYIIMAETVNKAKLSMIGMTVQVIFVVGELSCIFFGYFLQNSWQWQFMAMTVPAYIYLVLHIFLMPESARWLYSQKKKEKAEEVLRKIARINKRDPSTIHLLDSDQLPKPSQEILSQGEHEETDSDSQQLILNQESQTVTTYKKTEPNLFSLFGTVHSTMFTLSCAASWFSASLVYYGLTYDVQNIGGDFFLNAMLLTFTEIPAWLVCVAMNIFGRKKTFVISLYICSIACAILPFTEPLLDGNLQIGFAVIGKFLSAGAFDMLYVYTPEQFPTQLRSTGLTFCSAMARIASISAPFIIEIKAGPYNCTPFLIFAISGLMTGFLVQMVGVETKDKQFITTVEEFQQMAKTKQLKNLDTKDGHVSRRGSIQT